jgi:hypothetical protein
LRIGGTDRVDLYIAALNAHDGSGAFRLLITPIRVVCAPTAKPPPSPTTSPGVDPAHPQRQSRRPAGPRHPSASPSPITTPSKPKPRKLIDPTLTDAGFDNLARRLFDPPVEDASQRSRDLDRTRTDTLHWRFADADTQAAIRGTAWAGYQAVVEYVDHYAPARGTNPDLARAARLLTSDEPAQAETAAWTHLTQLATTLAS